MTELFVSAFVTFLVVIDPPGCAPIFASVTSGATPQFRRAMAFRSVVIAAFSSSCSAARRDLLHALGSACPLPHRRRLLLFLIAVDMVFEKRTARREAAAEEVARETRGTKSRSPEAIPMIGAPARSPRSCSDARSGVGGVDNVWGGIAGPVVTLLWLLLAGR